MMKKAKTIEDIYHIFNPSIPITNINKNKKTEGEFEKKVIENNESIDFYKGMV
jgi:hypothetical protein